MTTGSRGRPTSGNRRGGGGGFTRRRRGRNALKTEEIDYKDVQLMRRFVNERGKIISGQRIGVSAKNQRRLARAIKRAQHLALIPMAPTHLYVTGAAQTETQRPQETEPQKTESEEQEPQAQADAPQTEAPQTEAPQTEAPQTEASDQQSEVVSQTEEETVENNDASDQDTDAESDEKE